MPENMKRKITVEASTSKSKDTSRRPSVFERLGTKASNSLSAGTNPVSVTVSSGSCRHWAESGSCPYGKNCKYALTHTLISPSKQRLGVGLSVKDTDIKQKPSGQLVSITNPGANIKEDLNKRLHSAVVRKTRPGGSPDLNWENWDETDLEYEDEKELEKRKLLLQRELGVSSSSSTSASSSSSTESSSSSDDSSSTSSSTSADSRRKKLKTKSGKRDSSSSTSGTDRAQKKKASKSAKGDGLPTKKTAAARKDVQRLVLAKKKESPAPKKAVPAASSQTLVKKRSSTPTAKSRHRSATPPHSSDSKNKAGISNKKIGVRHSSPVPKRSLSQDRKEKRNHSASPRTSTKDRERERDREREKMKDKERDKEREREKERDKGKLHDRSRSPPKGKGKDRLSSPKRNSRPPRDSRKKESPEAGIGNSKDKGVRSPGKSRRSGSRGRGRDDSLDSKHVTTKSSPVVSRDAERRESNRNESRDPRDKNSGGKKPERDGRKGEPSDKGGRGKDVVTNKNNGNRGREDQGNNRRDGDGNRDGGRKINPGGLGSKDRDFGAKNDKDRNKDQRDSSRDNRDNRDNRDGRDNADPRLVRNNKSVREMREAAREKEREEALERCKERQRERDRKAREEKAREHERELPSLLMIATHNPIKSSTRNGAREGSKGLDKGSDRGSDRSHDKERGLDRERDVDKSVDRERVTERGDRDRVPTRAPERERATDRDRVLDRSIPDRDRVADRDRTIDRVSDRAIERDPGLGRERSFDRGLDNDRERIPLDRERGSDRERVQERDRIPDRGPIDRDRGYDRGPDRPPIKGPHDRPLNRGPAERGYDRGNDRSFDRDSDRGGFDRGHLERDERDYPLPPRSRDDNRRPPLPLEEKGPGYDSPYDGRRSGRDERGRYGEQLERNRYDEPIIPRGDQRRPGPDARNFGDDRRGRRDGGRNSLEPPWEGRGRGERRPGFERGDEPRSPGPPIKSRDWEAREYSDGRREWEGRGVRRGPPPDWDHQRRGDWLDKDGGPHAPIEDEWDMYGSGPNTQRDWPGGGERWPEEWERLPRSSGGPPGRPPPRPPPHRDEPPDYVQLRDEKPDVPIPVEVKEAIEDIAANTDKMADKTEEESVVKKPADEPEVAVTLKRPRTGSESDSEKPEAKKVCLDDSTPMEEDLSDISDDDADEILNREDIELATSIALEAQNLLQPQMVASPGCVTGSTETAKKELEQEKGPEKLDKAVVPMEISTEINDSQSLLPQDDETIDNLDFEEISDEELEEEAKAGLGDALGVDWASLVAESRPRIRSDIVPGSARRRWDGVRMLARLGISFRYAGQELVDKLTAKFESVNEEEKENEAEDAEELKFLHPVASIHVALREKSERRKALFASAGPYKRALSARRDLLVRRQLCNLPVNETTVETQGPNTEDIYRLAVQLFERSV